MYNADIGLVISGGSQLSYNDLVVINSVFYNTYCTLDNGDKLYHAKGISWLPDAPGFENIKAFQELLYGMEELFPDAFYFVAVGREFGEPNVSVLTIGNWVINNPFYLGVETRLTFATTARSDEE